MEETAGTSGYSRQSEHDYWRGFKPGDWSKSINVRDFIVRNVTPYEGDERFLVGPSYAPKRFGKSSSPVSRRKEKKACSRSMRKRLRRCWPTKLAISSDVFAIRAGTGEQRILGNTLVQAIIAAREDEARR